MNQRFYSLDVFRGATVALMILVNNPGSWSHLYGPLAHAPWHGCTPTDLVFPFFLFAVGNAMAFVLPRLEAAGTPVFLKKVFKRSILIFAIGLFLNWVPFVKWSDGELVFRHWVDPQNPESGVRILGVLQRIAICYLLASLIIYFLKIRGAIITSILILLIYWLLTAYLGATGDPYSLNGYFGTQVDKDILGIAHMYKGEGVPFDPEGLTSTLTSIVQVIFGFLVGSYIQKKGKTFEMVAGLFVAGSILIFVGFAWDMAFPINKKIWTSSYVLYTTGLAITVLSVLIYFIEFKNAKGNWSRFFDVFGKNALFVFALSGFLVKVLPLFRWVDHINEKGNPAYTSPLNWFYDHVCKAWTTWADPRLGSFLYAVCLLAFYWFIVYWMDKKKIYIKV